MILCPGEFNDAVLISGYFVDSCLRGRCQPGQLPDTVPCLCPPRPQTTRGKADGRCDVEVDTDVVDDVGLSVLVGNNFGSWLKARRPNPCRGRFRSCCLREDRSRRRQQLLQPMCARSIGLVHHNHCCHDLHTCFRDGQGDRADLRMEFGRDGRRWQQPHVRSNLLHDLLREPACVPLQSTFPERRRERQMPQRPQLHEGKDGHQCYSRVRPVLQLRDCGPKQQTSTHRSILGLLYAVASLRR